MAAKICGPIYEEGWRYGRELSRKKRGGDQTRESVRAAALDAIKRAKTALRRKGIDPAANLFIDDVSVDEARLERLGQ
jgi:hypothetical protein